MQNTSTDTLTAAIANITRAIADPATVAGLDTATATLTLRALIDARSRLTAKHAEQHKANMRRWYDARKPRA